MPLSAQFAMIRNLPIINSILLLIAKATIPKNGMVAFSFIIWLNFNYTARWAMYAIACAMQIIAFSPPRLRFFLFLTVFYKATQ